MTDRISLDQIIHTLSRDAVLLHPLPTHDTRLHVVITDVNQTACDLLRYSREELLDMPISDVVGSNTMGSTFFKTVAEDGYAECNATFTARNGSPVPMEVRTSLLQTESGPQCLTIARDTTERQQLKHALDTATRELEIARTAKQQFLSNMSHELRTPLNGFLGMTQILMGTELTPAQREYLSLSQDAARQLSKVLTDLLALSHVESGNLETMCQAFELHPALEGLISSLSRQAGDKSLSLDLDIAEDVPCNIKGDASKLRQILINLLSNAIRFTLEGGVTLRVTKTRQSSSEDNHCTLAFAVIDTGIGIPETKLETIFESFSLGENYLTKQYGGAGLGLAISRQLAGIMGGTLTVSSRHGEGSTFTLTLPFEIRGPKRETGAGECREAPSGLNILLAEDEQVNSIMASRLLKKAGHDVTIVGNGQQALETLADATFDLVLMDVQMPVINGVETTRIIRQGGAENVPRDLPIIGLTAFARSAEKKRFLEAGMTQVITKPYEADELILAVESVRR
ncbi:response regulator [Pseudodesulfovibrio cashew]|uniref:histidine kinase n=1 Tax=Pseudodesulfovibrio cashew TaxID=2678688 RepID=A0A6I6JJX5_9BACT|nr:ATP-binding protein [Pseudodesulfovibrio cashew]QGY40643.1 response regulator [Pseudodesulfovibrio cashew]